MPGAAVSGKPVHGNYVCEFVLVCVVHNFPPMDFGWKQLQFIHWRYFSSLIITIPLKQVLRKLAQKNGKYLIKEKQVGEMRLAQISLITKLTLVVCLVGIRDSVNSMLE